MQQPLQKQEDALWQTLFILDKEEKKWNLII